jgi:hypothetical protein
VRIPLKTTRNFRLNERWVREWLQQQAVSGLIEYDEGRSSPLSTIDPLLLVRSDPR